MCIFRLRRPRKSTCSIYLEFRTEPNTAFRDEQDQVAVAAVETVDAVPLAQAVTDENTPDSNLCSISPSPLSPLSFEATSISGSGMSSAVAASAHSETGRLSEDEDEYSDPEFNLLCSQVPESVLCGEKTWKGKVKEE